MRILLDPDTGELVEVIPEAVHDLTPYGYREAKAAHMRASRDRRDAEKAYEAAIRELGRAEQAYRIALAQEVLKAKNTDGVGATNAEVVAKGTERCAQARLDYTIADGLRYAALERLRGCDEDRKGISQLVAWSRAVATGPWGEGE